MNDTRIASISEQPVGRRSFLKGLAGGALGAAVVAGPAARFAFAQAPAAAPAAPPTGPFKLPPLPYGVEALEPHIDAMTMKIHHDRHHQAYVNNLNVAVKDTDLASMTVEQILKNLAQVPEKIQMAVRNNAGGHYNHSLFWTVMGPSKGGEPSGKLMDTIKSTFGSFDDFKKLFSQAGMTRFGSGWAWLNVDSQGKLSIESLPNQDSPLSTGKTPILGLDVWEHAYYLKYQNLRADYIKAWWNVVNWDEVGQRYGQG